MTLLAETVPGVGRMGLRRRLKVGAHSQTHPTGMRQYLALLQAAERAVPAKRFGLVAPLPVPHAPFIYNAHDGELTTSGGTYRTISCVRIERGLKYARRWRTRVCGTPRPSSSRAIIG